jgi:aralkylamine N-acetyltransferase
MALIKRRGVGKPGGEVIIKFVKNWPAKEIIVLYKAGGWCGRDSDPFHVRGIIRGSLVFAVAVDEATGKAVGMGRAISDGVSDAYIQDVVVVPKYRRMRVGRRIIEALRDYCVGRGIGWIALVAESGTPRLYRKLGFKTMLGHKPMRYVGSRR